MNWLLRRAVRFRSSSRLMISSANLAAQAINFIGGLIVARILQRDGRGLVATVSVYDEASSTALSLGVPAAVGHSAARVDGADAVRRAESTLLGSAVVIAVVSAPIAAIAAYLVDRYALGETPQSIRLLVIVAITATPFLNSIPQACRMILVARGQMARLAPIVMAPPVVRLTLFSVLALLGELTSGLAAASVLLGSWIGSAISWALAGVRPMRGGEIKPLLSYGLRTVPASLASLTNSRLDQLLMVPLLSTQDLGVYAVAVGVAFVPVNVGSALALSIFREAARDDAERSGTRTRFRQAVLATGGAGVVSAIGAAALIVPVYGSAFADSVTPALLLITGSAFIGLSLVVVQIANACGLPGVGSVSAVAALVVTIVGLIIALPTYGVVGAATVSLIAYLVRFVIAFAMVRARGLLGGASGSSSRSESSGGDPKRIEQETQSSTPNGS